MTEPTPKPNERFFFNDRFWRVFLPLAFLAGILLRLLFVQDMEYKEDEEYNFLVTQKTGLAAWPWHGMPSGVYVPNPGMSVWVFVALGKLLGVHQPTQLQTALSVFALLGIALVLPMALKLVRDPKEREPWLWAFALALVNPFLIYIHRKLWPEPFLPFFTMITLFGFKLRDRFWAAFVWGMIGAWLGQIHMSGFFFALGLVLWTLFFKRGKNGPEKTNWKGWFAGSSVGALPLIPWAYEILTHPVREKVVSGAYEALQLKYWVFWITNPVGLHVGNPLGLLRGHSPLAQLGDFVRYPLIAGQPTWIVGAAHVLLLGFAAWILGKGLISFTRSLWRKPSATLIGESNETAFMQSAALWGYGVLLTLSLVRIRRYYMMVNFPLEFIWLGRIALDNHSPARARRLLLAVWALQLIISAGFVGYVHVNEGSTQGDYGEAYHVVMKRRAEAAQKK